MNTELDFAWDSASETLFFHVDFMMYTIGSAGLLTSLSLTVVNVLENGKPGSRFPFIIDFFCKGQLAHECVNDALSELEIINRELENISCDLLVLDHRIKNESIFYMNEIDESAENLLACFLSKAGTVIMLKMERIFKDALELESGVTIGTLLNDRYDKHAEDVDDHAAPSIVGDVPNMPEAVEMAVEDASEYGFDLDCSEESINVLEELLDCLAKDLPTFKPTESQLWDVAFIYGGYLGELLLKHGLASKGFHWALEKGNKKNKIPILVSNRKEGVCAPIDKVYKRFVNGSEDDVVSFYKTMLMLGSS